MIDWARVTSLRHEVGEEEFRPLVELFLDEIEAAIMGVVPGDPQSLRHALNAMKGCAMNTGLTAFCRTCETWEAVIAAGRSDQLHIDLLMASYAAAKQGLMRDIDRMTADPTAGSGVA